MEVPQSETQRKKSGNPAWVKGCKAPAGAGKRKPRDDSPLLGIDGKKMTLKQRLEQWLQSHEIGAISKLADDPKQFGRLRGMDAVAVRLIADGARGGESLSRLLDRLVGKPSQEITGADGAPLVPQMDLMELARRTAFLLSLPPTTPQKAIDGVTLGVTVTEQKAIPKENQ